MLLCVVTCPTLGQSAAPSAAETAPPTAEEELVRARNLFTYGDYERATELLSELVLPGRLAKERDLIDAHRMLGISLYQNGKHGEARREFMALLYLAPDTRLDPFLTPPPVVEFFDGIREEIADKLVVVREKLERERAARSPTPTVTLHERTVRRHAWAGNFMPFGYAQFDRGAWGWGALFLGAQALGAVTAAGLYWGADALVDDAGFVAQDDRPVYDALRVAQWSAAAFTLAAYAAGVGEAVLSFTPESVESQQVREVPIDELPAELRPGAKE